MHDTTAPIASRRFFSSLRNKIIGLVIAAVLVSSLSISVVVYVRVSENLKQTALERIAGETRLIALKFEAYFDQMKSDAQVLADTPPITDLVRSISNGGIDPADRSTTSEWRKRLATIFKSIMHTRPQYTQVRYISANGNEIVRVNKSRQASEIVPTNGLQNKSEEPYFAPGLKLHRGEVYFSDVTFNREYGVVDATNTPTVRAVVPVFDDYGRNAGVVVINANYAMMLRQEFNSIQLDKSTFVVSGGGDYMEYSEAGFTQPFQMHDAYTETPPSFIADVLKTTTSERSFVTEDDIAYFVRPSESAPHANAFFGVIVRLPKAEFMAPAQQLLTATTITVAALIVFSLMAAVIVARHFMTPLNDMVLAIRNNCDRTVPQNLPLARADEIGDLARAFAARARELASSEARAAAVINNVFDGLLTIDNDGLVKSYNPACERFFGYSSSEMLGKCIALIFPEQFTNSNPMLPQLEQHLGHIFEVEALRKDGSRFSAELSISRVNLEDRTIFSCVVRDVTEQHKMRIALEEAERRWAIALNGSQIGVFDIDLVSGESIVSDTWLDMLGFDPGEAINAQAEWKDRIHPEDRELVEAADQACFDGLTPRSEVEYRLRRKSGRWIWLRSEATVAERDAAGKPLRFLGTQADITELKEAEAALKASEKRFRTATENAPIGMALVGLDGGWLDVNEAICSFLGYTENELMRLTFQDLTHPDDLEGDLDQVGQLLDGKIQTYQLEKRYIHKNGAIIWGLLSVSLVHDENGEPDYFISQILDITHLREVERLQGEFVSTVNHELRTPLTAIQGSLGLLKVAFSDRATDKEQRLIVNSYESCERLTRLVNDILDIQKMAAGEMVYNLETTDICTLTASVAESQAQFGAKWNVRIETQLPNDEIPIRLDRDRFSQALINLISNATKFSGDGDNIIVRVEELVDGGARISVQDFGPGIPKEFGDRIFGKFAQADGSSTRKAQGTGLGLNITKSIIESFGGHIDYSTEEGKGTTFFFELPAAEAEEQRSA